MHINVEKFQLRQCHRICYANALYVESIHRAFGLPLMDAICAPRWKTMLHQVLGTTTGVTSG